MAKTTTATPEPSPSEATMQQSELDELHTQVQAIARNDFHLGNVLLALVRHLGHAHGLEISSEKPAEAESEQ